MVSQEVHSALPERSEAVRAKLAEVGDGPYHQGTYLPTTYPPSSLLILHLSQPDGQVLISKGCTRHVPVLSVMTLLVGSLAA